MPTLQLLRLHHLSVLLQVVVCSVEAGRQPRVEELVQVPVQVGVLVGGVQLKLKAGENISASAMTVF